MTFVRPEDCNPEECSNGPNAMEPLPGHVIEAITGEQLAIDVAALTGRTVEEVKKEGVQTALVALYMSGGVPDDRLDLQRLAQGESFVRPAIETVDPPTGVAEPATGPAATDAAMGITASNGIGNTMPTGQPPVPNVSNEPNAALNAVPWEARRLMNEKMVQRRLSRNGPVSVEVSNALTAMDCGVGLTRVWNELDRYITAVVESDRESVVEKANDLADRMLRAQTQTNLGEALFKRESDENTTPMLSVLLSGTRAGGTTACRLDHPDQHLNGPMSSLRMRMLSLGIQPEMSGPNNLMIASGWTGKTKAERLFLSKGNWHVEWKCPPWAKENATDSLVNVYDWLCLPLSMANGLYTVPLNGSFNALSALRKTVQWFNQGVFEENANDEPIAFVVSRRTKTAAMRRRVAGGAGGNARMKLAIYSNRQFTDHISTHEWDGYGPNDWRWTIGHCR